MLVILLFLLLALSAVVAVPAPADDLHEHSNLQRRIPTIVGSKRHPRLQSKYDPIYDVCPGSVVDSGDYGVFSWYLYYSPANHGTNCAIVRNRSGIKRWMQLGLKSRRSDEYTDGQNGGYFKYYAGPVNETQTDHYCIDMYFQWDHSYDELTWVDMACG